MAIQGYTFDNQAVTPQADAITYEHNTDGIMRGCAMSITASTFTINSGHWIQGGRRAELTSAYTYSLPTGTADGYIRIKSIIDLTKVATIEEFGQVSFAGEFSTTTTFPALVQQDINGGNGTTYEMAWAILAVNGGSITALTASAKASSIETAGSFIVTGENGRATASIGASGSLLIDSDGHTIALRPNGSSTGQLTVSASGNVSASGTVSGTSLSSSGGIASVGSAQIGQYLYLRNSSGTTQAELRGTDSGFYISNENPGSIVLRPNGTTNATGQAVLSTAGDLSTTGALRPTGNIIGGQTAGTPLAISRANAGAIALRPNGATSESGQVYVDTSGNIIGEKYGGFAVGSGTGITLFRIGKMRILRVNATVNTLVAGANTLTGSLSTADRPTGNIYGSASYRVSNSIVGYGSVGANGNGQVIAYINVARSSATSIDGMIIWAVA